MSEVGKKALMVDKPPYPSVGCNWDGVDNETTRFPRITFKGGTHSSIESNGVGQFDGGAPTKTQRELAPHWVHMFDKDGWPSAPVVEEVALPMMKSTTRIEIDGLC